MKKILLLSAVLLGAATASQAGVRFSFGIPLPVPPVVVAPPAYVEPPSVYVDPPPIYAPAPPVLEFGFQSRPYYRPYSYRPFYGYNRYSHHDWDDHWRGGHGRYGDHGGHDWDHHRR